MEHKHSEKCPCSNPQVQQVLMAIGEDFDAIKVEVTLHYADGTATARQLNRSSHKGKRRYGQRY